MPRPIVTAFLAALVALSLGADCVRAVRPPAGARALTADDLARQLDRLDRPALPVVKPVEGFVYKGLYLGPYVASNSTYLKRLFEKSDRFNTLVVDVKTDFGFLVYPSNVPLARAIGANQRLVDLPALIAAAKARSIRLIARIVVFKDPYLAKYGTYGGRDGRTGEVWLDESGNGWVDPYSPEVWEYNIKIANEVLAMGFDEIQFDYVRFPTDGDIYDCFFPRRRANMSKEDAITGFVERARSHISSKISVDVFGYAAWRVLLREGQNLARIGKHVDYVCPMLYPSHFAPDFKREHDEFGRSYWIYYDSVRSAAQFLEGSGAQVVTYIQGFNYKSPWFGPDYVHTQILGSVDAGARGFFIWHAGGDYRTALEALEWLR